MGTEARSNSTAPTEYLKHICEVMQENEVFLNQNARDAYAEVVDLSMDAIDYLTLFGTGPEGSQEVGRHAMGYFVWHSLFPLSTAIYLEFVAGNFLACHMQLRLMLESMVTCYVADERHPYLEFFQDRLRELGKVNITDLMKQLDKKWALVGQFESLWRGLSNEWVHTQGLADRIVHHVVHGSYIPPGALVVPMNYAECDGDALEELRHRVSQFRFLLKTVMDNYKQEGGLGT